MLLSQKLKRKIQYIFDNQMSKGPIRIIIFLIMISFTIILFFAVLVSLFGIYPQGENDLPFVEAFWISMMRTLDPGTMGDDTGWPFRIMMLLVTSYGIVMLSTFIGLISNGILKKVQDLRKGRSRVDEKNHILILGWSPKIHTIVSELIIANENQKNAVIVILAEKDKVEMEDELKERIGNYKNTKIVCRTGNPIDLSDLEISNPVQAKSIIILDKDHENSDAEIIKVILGITTNPNRRKEPYHIVAEIEDEKNLEVAKMVGKDEVELVMSDEFISKIMVQTSRQSGLSVVYTDFLDFDGDEIYFHLEDRLFGKTFRDVLFAYEDSCVIGLQMPNGKVLINPPMDSVIEIGTSVIAISEDDDRVIMNDQSIPAVDDKLIVDEPATHIGHEKILIMGWNRRTKIVIRELGNYMEPGSVIKIVSEFSKPEATVQKLNETFPEIKIEYQQANTTDKEVIQNLDIKQYNHLLLLSYQDNYDHQEADSKTLITLLHIRNIAEQLGTKLNIVSEMLDVKNRELARVTNADDFIVSDNIISLLMSQVSENKFLMRVFEILFQSEGSEVYLKPASNYINTGVKTHFYNVLESSIRKNEIAIGYRVMADQFDGEKAYGVVLNPPKSDTIIFKEEDRVIVLAED